MEIVICALAKNEHLYINEWVEHYVNLGFDKIYIYDNDDLDKPYIKDFIDPKYLEKCVIKNIRGQQRPKLQHDIYTGFYAKYGKTFDWCLFCDIDEFLVGIENIHSFLMQPQFKKALQIRIKWRLFGDSGLIERDMSKSVMETFTQVVKSSLHRNLVQKGNLEQQGKALQKKFDNNKDIVAKKLQLHTIDKHLGMLMHISIADWCTPMISNKPSLTFGINFRFIGALVFFLAILIVILFKLKSISLTLMVTISSLLLA